MTTMVVEIPDGYLTAAREVLSSVTGLEVNTRCAGSALTAGSNSAHTAEVHTEAIAFFLVLGQNLGIFNFSQVHGEPLSGKASKTDKPVVRRHHRKLGPNVVDLVAKRRERDDAEISF